MYLEKSVDHAFFYLPELLLFEADVIFVGALVIVGFLVTVGTFFFSKSISVKSSLTAAEASVCLNK